MTVNRKRMKRRPENKDKRWGERGKLSWDQRPGCLNGRLNKAPEQIINNLCTKRQFLFLYQTKKMEPSTNQGKLS